MISPVAFFDQLSAELTQLPGEVAHKDMLPFRETVSEAFKKPVDYRLSAVLLLLFPYKDDIYFVLTERQDYDGKHAGQISFPGGKAEPFDKNTAETALRETQEEIGVLPTAITILGRLTEVYIPVSNFLIHPYVGYTEKLPSFIPDPREVKATLLCSVSDLLNDELRVTTKFETAPGVWMKDIPAFNFQNKKVWGATAIMLNEFKFMLQRMYKA